MFFLLVNRSKLVEVSVCFCMIGRIWLNLDEVDKNSLLLVKNIKTWRFIYKKFERD